MGRTMACDDTMSTALHLKLTSNDYFNNFPTAQTYVHAAANSNNGFKLLYRIIEIIHPRLRAENGGLNKTIEAPIYADVQDDSIYTFITRYENYLMFEELSPENRTYTKREQCMYIFKALIGDKSFRPELLYL